VHKKKKFKGKDYSGDKDSGQVREAVCSSGCWWEAVLVPIAKDPIAELGRIGKAAGMGKCFT